MRLIDADELMKHAGNCYDEQGHLLYAVGTGNIMAAKTIDPVKHGKWINDKGLYRCSVCNYLWTSFWAVVVPEERMYKEMKYCPNCGAKMDGGEG